MPTKDTAMPLLSPEQLDLLFAACPGGIAPRDGEDEANLGILVARGLLVRRRDGHCRRTRHGTRRARSELK